MNETAHEKPLEQKIKECKELIIQNMEKTLQNKMVYMFLKDHKKDADIKSCSVNSKDGIVKLEFHDHDKAEAFYREANFNEKILIRPFNIYYNLQLTEAEMKKYYLEGITEENQRKLFEAALRFGPCKLYTSYGSGTRAKLKSTGLLSLIRRESLTPQQFKELTEELLALGIKISKYVHDKGMKVSLNLINYLPDSHIDTDENALQDLADNEAKSILLKYAPDANVVHLSVLVKKKEAIEGKSGVEAKPARVSSSALFEFENIPATYEIYEKVRKGIVDAPLGKVRLFFHNEENNSFLSLFTQGLVKPADQSEKQFEEVLIKAFQEINPNVVQVNVYKVKLNDTYIGRIYLTSEEKGKEFIVEYANHRSKLYTHFRPNTTIVFNISIDNKTLRKIKLAERKAKETEEKIKKQGEATRREPRANAPSRLPSGAMINPMMPNIMGGVMGPPPGMGMGGMVGGIPPRIDNIMGMPPGFGKGLPGAPMIPPPPMGGASKGISLQGKVSNLLRDRERVSVMEENAAKRVMVDPIVGLLEQELGLPSTEATRIVSTYSFIQTSSSKTA
jgi:hypothetical protein